MAKLPTAAELGRAQVRPVNATPSGNPEGGIGAAMEQFGRTVTDIALREKAKIDESDAQNAVNQLRRDALELTAGEGDANGKPKGYSHIKGADAVRAPEEGRPALLPKYTELLKQRREALESTLGGNARALFGKQADAIGIDFQAGILRHSANELDNYNKYTLENAISTGEMHATANYNNPSLVQGTLDEALRAQRRLGESRGMPESEGEQAAVYEKIVGGAVRGALAKGDFATGEAYVKQYGDKLGDKLLNLTNLVDHAKVTAISNQIRSNLVTSGLAEVNPSEGTRAYSNIHAVAGEYKLPVASKEEFNKALRESGGNVDLAIAKTLTNPEEFAKAQAAAEADAKAIKLKSLGAGVVAPKGTGKLLDYLPPEVSKAAREARQRWEMGAGVPEVSMDEYVARGIRAAEAAYGPLSPTVLAAVRNASEAAYNDVRVSENQKKDKALHEAYVGIDVGKYARYDNIPPSVLGQLGHKERTALRSYFDTMRKNRDAEVEENVDVAVAMENLRSQPALLASKSMDELISLGPFVGPKNLHKLVELRFQYVNNPNSLDKFKMDEDNFRNAAEAAGIPINTKEGKLALGKLREYVKPYLKPGMTPEQQYNAVVEATAKVPSGAWYTRDKRAFESPLPKTVAEEITRRTGAQPGSPTFLQYQREYNKAMKEKAEQQKGQ